MTDELKPCPNPWCKSEVHDGHLGIVAHRVPYGLWRVSCSCGMKAPAQASEAEAIAAWHTRPDSAVQELVDALEATTHEVEAASLCVTNEQIRAEMQAVADNARRLLAKLDAKR